MDTRDVIDWRLRLQAFDFLDEAVRLHGDVIPKTVLQRGFDVDGTRVSLIAPQGIFKPALMELPLTFCTVPPKLGKPRPYEDELGDDGLIRYRYRGTDPAHRDNLLYCHFTSSSELELRSGAGKRCE